MINPQLEQLFKEAKYHLIEKQMDKCSYKVNKALQMHPYHTQMLILSSYIHRSKENYELALSALETANRTLEDKSLES